MGTRIEVYSYRFVGLLEEFRKVTGKYDIAGTLELLETYGDIVDTRFIILRNDLWEDGNPYDRLYEKIDELYGDGSADAILNQYSGENEHVDFKELKNYIED